jgi:hypothetical protein
VIPFPGLAPWALAPLGKNRRATLSSLRSGRKRSDRFAVLGKRISYLRCAHEKNRRRFARISNPGTLYHYFFAVGGSIPFSLR